MKSLKKKTWTSEKHTKLFRIHVMLKISIGNSKEKDGLWTVGALSAIIPKIIPARVSLISFYWGWFIWVWNTFSVELHTAI